MMASLASRRAILCGVASVPVIGCQTARADVGNPALARLVGRYERFDRMLEAGAEVPGWPDARLVHITGRLRHRIASFPAAGLPDVMLKARVILVSYGVEGWQSELASHLQDGHAFIETVAASMALDLMRMLEPHAA